MKPIFFKAGDFNNSKLRSNPEQKDDTENDVALKNLKAVNLKKLKSELLTIIENYFQNFSKLKLPHGKQVAEHLKIEINKFEGSATQLIDRLVIAAGKSSGEGIFSTSTDLRADILQGLCTYLKISDKQIANKTNKSLAMIPMITSPVVEIVKQATIIGLIKQKNIQTLQEIPSVPVHESPKLR
jgi:septum formation topological specificity factor MinE